MKVQHHVDEGADVLWQEQLEWDYEIDEMAFLRSVFADANVSSFRLIIFEKVDDLRR